MARCHCDYEIKPAYVREVCRLMKTSNISLVKADLEFEEIQNDLNKEVQKNRGKNNFMAGANNVVRFIQLYNDHIGNGRQLRLNAR